MSNTNNTPCGCRCNSANDTHRVTLVLEGGTHLEGYIEQFGTSRAKLFSQGGFVEANAGDNPLTVDRVETYAEVLKEFLSALDREIVNSAIIGDRKGDLLHPERELMDSVRELLDRRIGVAFQPHRNRRSSLALLDSFKDQLLSRRSHCSSPVVAESEADTSDAPAMTVQEGGSSDAAPGVEGVSPASSTPRFVVVGYSVYDRQLDRACDALTHPSGPEMIAERLNAGHQNVAGLRWEDAK